MSLTDEYKRQQASRDWDTVLDALPSLAGATVLDLGCGVSDVTELLSRRGAHVVGVDMNEELLTAARARRIPRAEFRSVDLWSLPPPEDLAGAADGLWCGFTVAYFTDPAPVVSAWTGTCAPAAGSP
jgi:trans-aconitate methyltransferase